MVFIASLRMLGDAAPSKLDVMLLPMAGFACLALLYHWRRAPGKFGHDPELAAQLLMHGLAIMTVALATLALAWFAPVWIALTAVAIVSAMGAMALSCARFQQSTERLWHYARMVLASASLMGSIAAGMLWFGQRDWSA